MTSRAISDALAQPKAGTIRAAFTHPELRWYLLHHAVAGTAQSLGTVAVAVSLYEQTHATRWVAMAAVARLLPYLILSGPAGVLAGRVNPRRLLVWSSVLRALVLAAVALAVGSGAPAAAVVALVFLATSIGTPCYPALAALVPSLVPAEDLAPANGLLNSIETTSWMIGPAAGGLLLLVTTSVFTLAANAVFFALGVAALVPTSAHAVAFARGADPPHERLWTALSAGVRTIAGSVEVAVPLMLVLVVNVVFGGATVGLLLVSRELLHGGRGGFGLLSAALGFGGFVGVVVTNRISASRRPELGIMAATFLAGFPFAALAIVRSSWLAAGLMVLAGAGAVITEVAAMSVMLRSLPRSMIARVFGLTDSLLVGSVLAGALLAPLLIDLTGLKASLVIVGAVLPITAIVGARQWQRLAERASLNRAVVAPRLDLLAAQPWLAYALPTVLESLAANAVEEEILAGSVLIHQGDRPDDFYLILDGELEVTQVRPGTTSRTVNRLGPGEGFGEVGLMSDAGRTATVIARRRLHLTSACGRLRTDCRSAGSPARVLRVAGEHFVAAVNAAPMAADGSVGGGLIARMASGAVGAGGPGPEDRR